MARFDTIALAQEAPDRVRISGVVGEAPPPTLKVSLNYLGGFRNSMTLVLTGLDADAEKARDDLLTRVEKLGRMARRIAERRGDKAGSPA